MKYKILILLVCAMLLLAVAAAYVRTPDSTPAAVDMNTAVVVAAADQGERHPPPGSREYRNEAYHFSIFYPQYLSVSEHREKNNAITILFQSVEKGEGFQLYILPYREKQVREDRFKKDIPSGVRIGLVDVTIDGARGAAFYSTDAMLGDTREIWFIRGDWLYEVTTLKPLDMWLDQIMQTWRFI